MKMKGIRPRGIRHYLGSVHTTERLRTILRPIKNIFTEFCGDTDAIGCCSHFIGRCLGIGIGLC